MTMGSLSRGRTSTTSGLEKVMLVPASPYSPLGNPMVIGLEVKICLVYFLRGELELPLMTKPPSMVLTIDYRVLLVIFMGIWKRT